MFLFPSLGLFPSNVGAPPLPYSPGDGHLGRSHSLQP